jgi:hypothetical protein
MGRICSGIFENGKSLPHVSPTYNSAKKSRILLNITDIDPAASPDNDDDDDDDVYLDYNAEKGFI